MENEGVINSIWNYFYGDNEQYVDTVDKAKNHDDASSVASDWSFLDQDEKKESATPAKELTEQCNHVVAPRPHNKPVAVKLNPDCPLIKAKKTETLPNTQKACARYNQSIPKYRNKKNCKQFYRGAMLSRGCQRPHVTSH